MMASVRASVINQARVAASRGGGRADDIDDGVVTQLVRCARLSPDAADTLEWALDALDAHGTTGADEVACRLLRAARARLDSAGGADSGGHRARQPVWV